MISYLCFEVKPNKVCPTPVTGNQVFNSSSCLSTAEPTVSSITPLSGNEGRISVLNDFCMDAGLLNAGAQVVEMPQPTVSPITPLSGNEGRISVLNDFCMDAGRCPGCRNAPADCVLHHPTQWQ